MLTDMAGGMRRGRGVPLSERTRGSSVEHDDRTPPAEQADDCARHCWVHDTRWPCKLPGLLLRWDRRPDGWRALVVYATPEPDAVEQHWVDAADLTPA
jgi:hypothetical protein